MFKFVSQSLLAVGILQALLSGKSEHFERKGGLWLRFLVERREGGALSLPTPLLPARS